MKMNSQNGLGRSSWKQWIAAFAASSIMFNKSFLDIPWITEPFENVPVEELFLSIVIVTIGAFLGAVLADIFGRKKILLGALIFVIPRMVGLIFTEDSYRWMWIVKIIIEFGSGITCTVVPLYISEIAGSNNRGTLMVVQLVVQMIGTFIITGLQTVSQHSKLQTLDIIIDGVIMGIGVLFHAIVIAIFPETPHYLNSKKKYQEAAQSLAFFREMSHVKIREDSHELTPMYAQTNRNKEGCCGKVCGLFQFANRRSLAVIFSLLAIRWASGQYRNERSFIDWALYWDKNYILYAMWAIFGIQLFFSAFVALTIDIFKRKLPVVLVILVGLIAAIVGMAILNHEVTTVVYWIHFGVFIVQDFCHFIIIGVTLAYVGEFFPTNVKALAIATVVSFELFIRNMCILSDYGTLQGEYIIELGRRISFLNGPVYIVGLLFVLIFFPRINKVPCSEIAIETSAGIQSVL